MAEDNFKNILVGFILIILFGYLLIFSVNSIGSEYGMDTGEVTGGSLNENNFYGNVSGVRTASQNFQLRFAEGNVWSALAGVVVEGIFGIARDMVKLIISPFSLISNIFTNLFGIPSIVVDVILGILIMVVILSIWRLIKIGD
jgi:hypothetical protein